MKAIVSVIGKDQKGIIAKTAMSLYEMNINIEDISQTIMQNQYFTMIMMVSLENTTNNFDEIDKKLQELSQDMGVEIRIQHENIFKTMHRI